MSIPEQPFGFVAGRWVLSLADTPMDSDRAPDYKPLHPGSVVFNNKLSHRVITDGSGTVGIVKTRIEARLNADGKLVDAEYNEFIALPVGVYSVTFSFGQYSWPNFDIEVKPEHTVSSPLWLPSKSPIPSGPGVVHVVSEEARLAAEAAAASAWEAVDTPGRRGPQGVPGPPGDLDAEHLAGAPRLTNLVKDATQVATVDATIDSQIDRTVKFTATAYNGFMRWFSGMVASASYYFAAEVKATSDQVFFGSTLAPVYHSGSGDWERLTGWIASSSVLSFLVRDTRSSGWDQIEVRDPVLINLTEVFGAGREPSKEYMDALLAKHGNYIGVVDQFGFGDALQALTVAGSGMTLRQQHAINGERVFLDYPGGSTMLYGDTGWIDIMSLLTTGFEPSATLGYLKARRIGINIEIAGRIRVKSDAPFVGNSLGSVSLLTLPYGFRTANAYNHSGHAILLGGHSYVLRTGTISEARIVHNQQEVWPAGQTVEFVLRYPTVDPWPTTLPGTPL